jgi:acid stress-induced BolA-like protein IbaG/YrbA
MPSTEWMESEVRAILPNCVVEVTDLTGGSDHFHVRVVDASFTGMRPLQRQKIILNHFKAHIPHSIHAIDIRAMTPEQAETTGDTVFHPHGDGQGIHVKSIEKRQSKLE